MTFPIFIRQVAEPIAAELVGSTEMRVTAATREEALAKLEAAIARRFHRGEFVAPRSSSQWLGWAFRHFPRRPNLEGHLRGSLQRARCRVAGLKALHLCIGRCVSR